mgnify:CR=1 FL=1
MQHTSGSTSHSLASARSLGGSDHAWMQYVLAAAGVYNLLWGAATILFPNALFQFAEITPPRYPQIWQCVGMIVGVYGIGYLIAATDPLRHWPITLVGLLGKIFGPIGFVIAVVRGDLPLSFGVTILTNDLIWWIPFAAIIYQKYKQYSDLAEEGAASFEEILDTATSHRGATLSRLSRENPTLVVFLRHVGCTFCRETLWELSKIRSKLEARGVALAFVHMSEPLEATQVFSRYGLDHVHRFSDPTCEIYQAFGLQRGSFSQLFRPRVFMRGIAAGWFSGHGVGPVSGDAFRMPGLFLLDRGKVDRSYYAQTAADRPDYLKFACGSRLPDGDASNKGEPIGAMG